jgi:3'-phosphoadenosine 5'-phosphosulfate sulfotransferase (PAPS reductase)/FAD synthetase
MNIATDPVVDRALAAGSPVAIGVSGGKDSVAAAWATVQYLRRIGHSGPRILVHADLGRVEWQDSAPTCERLSQRLGLELVTVRRTAGDMMDRWLTRWSNNCERYANLECVQLILPWSTPSMRFCTSELKTAVICRELIRRFPGQQILSVSGIRREESANRAKAPVVKQQPKLSSVTHKTYGFDWHPIIDWKLEDVLVIAKENHFAQHEAYTKYGASRVSCAFCIMSAAADLRAAVSCPDNLDLYREMCDLELRSTFAFQSGKWLCDVSPSDLTVEQRRRVGPAKETARIRAVLEDRLPKSMLYQKGWPTAVPSLEDADLLATVRKQVADGIGLQIKYTTARSIVERYEELMATKKAQNKYRSKRVELEVLN